MADEFALDPRIEGTSVPVADWPLCHVRLKDDARFHWLLLMPRRAGRGRAHRPGRDRLRPAVRRDTGGDPIGAELAKPDKTNVATLGNVVAQMHVHVIGRFHSDPAWPDPVWCHGAGPAYPPHALAMLADRYAKAAGIPHFQGAVKPG